MKQSFTKAQIIAKVKDALMFFAGASLMGDDAYYNIAEQAAIEINRIVNESNSDLFSTDSIIEVDVADVSAVRSASDVPVAVGANDILFTSPFPAGSKIHVTVNGYIGPSVPIQLGPPHDINVNGFSVQSFDFGFITYIAHKF